MPSSLSARWARLADVIDFSGDAVLFDLDGTLVDSSASVLRAWQRVSGALGIPFAAFEPYVHGIPAPEVFAIVAPQLSAAEVRDLSEEMLAAQARRRGRHADAGRARGTRRAAGHSMGDRDTATTASALSTVDIRISSSLGIIDGAACPRRLRLRFRSLGGDLADDGVVGVQASPVRRQHFQCAEAMPQSAVDQL